MSEEMQQELQKAISGLPYRKMSAAIGNWSLAFSKAQLEMKGAVKDSVNPMFGSSYADLGSVIGAMREPFAKNELAVSQECMNSFSTTPAECACFTLISHSSNEWKITEYRVPIPNKTTKDGKVYALDPQTVGSASTYARRFGLEAACNIPRADDDGNAIAATEPEAPRSATDKAKQMLQDKMGWKPSTPPPPEDHDYGHPSNGQPPPEDNADLFGPPDSAPQGRAKSTVTLPFGKSKGKTLDEADMGDLKWVLGTLKESIVDPAKKRFAKSNKDLATAIEDELIRRGD